MQLANEGMHRGQVEHLHGLGPLIRPVFLLGQQATDQSSARRDHLLDNNCRRMSNSDTMRHSLVSAEFSNEGLHVRI